MSKIFGILFISLFLFVSCDELSVEDSILNHKGGVVVYKSEGKNEWTGKWKMKVRIKENGKNGEHYLIKTIKVVDGDLYCVGDTIK